MAFHKGNKVNIGRIPWNKGTKGICKSNSGTFYKGIKFSRSHREAMSKGKLGHPCYNTGRTQFKKGHIVSEETKQKICLSCKNRIISLETRKKISLKNKGRKQSLEHSAKISNALKGHKPKCSGWNRGISPSKHTRNKISKSLKGRFKGKDSPHWKGGRIVTNYVWIYMPEHKFANPHGYVLEHRVIVENIIKRNLNPWETVHHINRDSLDNRIPNLMVFKNHGWHNKFACNIFIDSSNIIFDGRQFTPSYGNISDQSELPLIVS